MINGKDLEDWIFVDDNDLKGMSRMFIVALGFIVVAGIAIVILGLLAQFFWPLAVGIVVWLIWKWVSYALEPTEEEKRRKLQKEEM